MKKTLSLALALLLIFVMTGCQQTEKEKEAYDFYLSMTEATKDIKSQEISISGNVSASVADETIDFDYSSSAKQVLHSETDLDMEMVMQMDMSAYGLGMVSVTSYYTDGYMYQDMLGMKMKMPLPMDDVVAQAGLEMIQLEKDAISNSEVTDVEGGKQLSFTLKGDMLSEYVNSITGPQLASLGVGAEGADVKIGDVIYTAVVDENYMPIKQSVVISIEMTIEEETLSMTMDMNYDYISINAFDSIEFPDDLDSYSEIA